MTILRQRYAFLMRVRLEFVNNAGGFVINIKAFNYSARVNKLLQIS